MKSYRRSGFERSVAISVTLICLALLAWTTFNIFQIAKRDNERSEVAKVYAISTPPVVGKDQNSGTVLNNSAVLAQPSPLVRTEPTQATSSSDRSTAEFEAVETKLKETSAALQIAAREAITSQNRIAALEQQNLTAAEEAKARTAELDRQMQAVVQQKQILESEVAGLRSQLSSSQRRVSELSRQLQLALQVPEDEEVVNDEDRASEEAAAEDTHSAAQAAYLAGDYPEAARIWQALAEQGSPRAQFHYGSLLYEGRLGEPDLVGAYLLLSEAIQGGFGPALAMRERVRGAMTSEEISRIAGF